MEKLAKRRDLYILGLQAATIIVFFLLWEWASATRMIDPIFIGRPTKIFAYLYEAVFVDHTLLKDAAWTLFEMVAAFSLGSIAGIAFGLLFVLSPSTEKYFSPFLAALNSLPRVALAPLFLLWFGLGPASKIALGFSLTYFIVLYNTVAGARSVDPDWIVLARMLGASKVTIFFKVTLISAVPMIFSGLRIGLIFSLLGVIVGEMIAAQHGLGQLLAYLAGSFRTDGVFGVLFFLAILGLTLTRLTSAVENHLLRWR